MAVSDTKSVSTIGVLDYRKYTEQFIPLVERARRSSTAVEALTDLKAFIMGIADQTRREAALAQLERIEVAVNGARWHRSAAGHVLEAGCVDEPVVMPDLSGVFVSCMDFIYAWNEDHAETIYRFFSYLSDRTIPWASPTDTWRAALPPQDLKAPSEAMAALSPRDLRKMLETAQNGDVFSEDEAKEMAFWWEEFRKKVRMADRLECGLYICVKSPPLA